MGRLPSGERAVQIVGDMPEPRVRFRPQQRLPQAQPRELPWTSRSLPIPAKLPAPQALTISPLLPTAITATFPPRLRKTRVFLKNVMVENGFVPYSGEWWHYSDSVAYDVRLIFLHITDKRSAEKIRQTFSLNFTRPPRRRRPSTVTFLRRS